MARIERMDLMLIDKRNGIDVFIQKNRHLSLN